MSIAHLTVNNSHFSLRSLYEGVSPEARITPSSVLASVSSISGAPEPTALLSGRPAFRWDPVGQQIMSAPLITLRGPAARVQVSSNTLDMHLALRGARPVRSFNEAQPISRWIKLDSVASGSVLSTAVARGIYGNIQNSIFVPSTAGSTAAEHTQCVKTGMHVDLITARIVAFALNHALVGSASRLRPSAASAVYLYRDGSVTHPQPHTISDPANLDDALGASAPNARYAPHSQVVYVGPAALTYGMALISAVARAGGPIYNENSELLSGMDSDIDLVMVGDRVLTSVLPNVQAADFWVAIDEALIILMEYNNVQSDRINYFLAALMNNLLVLNTTAYAETQNAAVLNLRNPGAGLGPRVALTAAQEAVLQPLAAELDGAAFQALPLAVRHAWVGQIGREALMAIPDDAGILGTVAYHRLDSTQARLLLAGSVAPVQRAGQGGAFPAQYGVFSSAALVAHALPAWVGGQQFALYQPIMGVFAGRSLYAVFVQHVAGVPLPPGLAPAINAGMLRNALDLIVARPMNVSWHLAGNAYVVNNGDQIVIGHVHPVGDANTAASWEPLPDQASRFDMRNGVLDINLGVQVQQRGWMRANARSIHNLAAAAPDDVRFSALTYTVNDLAGAAIVDPWHRFATWFQCVAQVWWMSNRSAIHALSAEQWRQANGGIPADYTIPDETLNYLGGTRVEVPLVSCGGMWSMAYLEPPRSTLALAATNILHPLRDACALADSLCLLRAAQEAASFLLNFGMKRLEGNANSVTAPLAAGVAAFLRTGYHDRFVSTSSEVFSRTMLTARAFLYADRIAVPLLNPGTIYTAEMSPHVIRVAGQDPSMVWHLNFVRPHIINTEQMPSMLGVAYPTYRGDTSINSYLATVEWVRGLALPTNIIAPFLAYLEDIRLDSLCFLLEGITNGHWAVAAWQPKEAPSNALDVVDLFVRNAAGWAMPRLETRTCLPYSARAAEVHYELNPRAVGLLPRVLGPGGGGALRHGVLDDATAALPAMLRPSVLRAPHYVNLSPGSNYRPTVGAGFTIGHHPVRAAPTFLSAAAAHALKALQEAVVGDTALSAATSAAHLNAAPPASMSVDARKPAVLAAKLDERVNPIIVGTSNASATINTAAPIVDVGPNVSTANADLLVLLANYLKAGGSIDDLNQATKSLDFP